jgi:hypothetical protein
LFTFLRRWCGWFAITKHAETVFHIVLVAPKIKAEMRAQLFQLWLPERREVRIRHRRDGVSVDEFGEAGLQLGEEDISLAGHVVEDRK